MDGSEVFEISLHVLTRFKERWEILRGKPLEEEDVLSKLQGLILNAKSELDNLALTVRRERYGGQGRYMITGPWRLIFACNTLVTVELRYCGTFSRPQLYPGEIREKFYLRITEQSDATLIERSVFKDLSDAAFLSLAGKSEINAIIRLLRLLGMGVDYKRTGTEMHKQACVIVRFPHLLREFEVKEAQSRKVWLQFQNKEELRPIVGLFPADVESILSFLRDEQWISAIKAVREAKAREERIRRNNERAQWRREKQRRRKEARAKRLEQLEQEKASKRTLSEILQMSTNPFVIWDALRKDYRKQIRTEECKLGKTWILRYYFFSDGIIASSEIREAMSLKDCRRMVISDLISQLRHFLMPAP